MTEWRLVEEVAFCEDATADFLPRRGITDSLSGVLLALALVEMSVALVLVAMTLVALTLVEM